MITSVMYGMITFLTLLFMFMILYLIVFLVLKDKDANSIGLLKGAFDETIILVTMAIEPRFYNEPMLWFLIIVGIVIVPIVMFNLLIAVIEQVFNGFEENRKSEELREIADLCLEIEWFKLFFNRFKKDKYDPLYLYDLRYSNIEKKEKEESNFITQVVAKIDANFQNKIDYINSSFEI